ncbi:MAG: PspC domain-containing protein [Gammaproteobacteria bacterium]|nr:PspC domain-containing protein [Gammaproteobacteria bacterium]MXY53348.1 PspC domain-containing protein [Gammaproteobacteria bacterium]
MRDQLERLRGSLVRDRRGWIGGVCAGLANFINVDPTFVRIGVLVAAIFFPKIVIASYIIAWLLLDKR